MNKLSLLVVAIALPGWAATVQAGAGCAAVCASKPVAKAAESAAHSAKYGTMDTAAVKSLVESGSSAVIVDARSAKWDDGKRIPGAVSLTADSPAEEIEKAIPSKDALVVAYCSNLKCPASAKLAEKLVALGYKNVIKYPEGLQGWIEAGNAVTEIAKPD